MKASEWIDAVAAAEGGCSDYRVAKVLGISKQAVSKYRTRGGTLDETVARKVEKHLGLKPGTVMIDQLQERATDPEVKAIFQRLGKMVAGLAATLTLTMGVVLGAYERASAAQHEEGAIGGYRDYYRRMRKWWRALGRPVQRAKQASPYSRTGLDKRATRAPSLKFRPVRIAAA